MTESYIIHIVPDSFGEKVEILVMHRETGSQTCSRALEAFVPNLIAAYIAELRDRQYTPDIRNDEFRIRRRSAALEAATNVFGDEIRASGWLLSPNPDCGWHVPMVLASSNDEGLALVCALLSKLPAPTDREMPDRFERVLLARDPNPPSDFAVENVEFVTWVDLLGDPAAGTAAWLLEFPGRRFEVIIEGIGWVRDPEQVLEDRLKQYREAIQKTEAFLVEARRLAAFSRVRPAPG